MKQITMMKRTRSRLNNGRGRLGYNKPTLAEGQEVRPRLNNVQQSYEKYISLARDALTSGDRITAEGYYQHAEHYLRLMNEYKVYLQEKNEQDLTSVEDSQGAPLSESTGGDVVDSKLEVESNIVEENMPEQLVA